MTSENETGDGSAQNVRTSGKSLIIAVVVLTMLARAYHAFILRYGLDWRVWLERHPFQALLTLVPAAIVGSWLAGIAARRWIGNRIVLPSAIAGGVVATAMVNGIIGATIGMAVGVLMVSGRVRRIANIAMTHVVSIGGICCVVSMLTGFWFNHRSESQPITSPFGIVAIGTTAGMCIAIIWLSQRREQAQSAWIRLVCQLLLVALPSILLGFRTGIELHRLWQVHRINQHGNVSLDIAPKISWEVLTGVRHLIQPYHVMLERATDSDLMRLRFFRELLECSFVNSKLTSSGFASLGSMPSLNHVWIEETPIDDDGLRQLLGQASPSYVFLSGTQVSDASVSLISRWTVLRSLRIKSAKYTGTGYGALAKCRTIDWLELEHVGMNDQDLASVATLPVLRHLSIVGNRVTGAGLQGFKNSLRLESLRLSDNPIDDRYLAFLTVTPLSWFQLKGVRLTTRGWQSISQMQKLDHLSLARSQYDGRSLSSIVPLLGLDGIDIDGSQLDARGTKLPIGSVTVHVSKRKIDAAEVNRLATLAHMIEQTRPADVVIVLEECSLTAAAVAEFFHHPFRLFTVYRGEYDSRFRDALASHTLLRN